MKRNVISIKKFVEPERLALKVHSFN
jgi:hypothetical protein